MAKVSVYNMDGKEVGTTEKQASGNSEGQDTLRGFRRRKKALETEGHRSCQTGFNKSTTVDRRRNGIRTSSKRLFIQDE